MPNLWRKLTPLPKQSGPVMVSGLVMVSDPVMVSGLVMVSDPVMASGLVMVNDLVMVRGLREDVPWDEARMVRVLLFLEARFWRHWIPTTMVDWSLTKLIRRSWFCDEWTETMTAT